MKFRKKAFVAAVSFLVLGSSWVPAQAGPYDFDGYTKVSQEVISMLGQKNFDQAKVLQKVDDLIQRGVVIAKAYSGNNAVCKKALDPFVADNQKMKDVSLEEIESLYHDAGIIKKSGIKDVDPHDAKYEKCLDVSHFIVHPATIPILMRLYNKDHNQKHLDQMKKELVELFDHMKYIK